MLTHEISLFLNCQKLDFANTLGVANVLMNLARHFQHFSNLILVADGENQIRGEEAFAEFGVELASAIQFSDLDTFQKTMPTKLAVEILPHHFQKPEFGFPSIVICHDLHPYDIPWKYENPKSSQQLIRDTCSTATAVITHFPRTYCDLERTIGETLPNLFLTPSPLMKEPVGIDGPQTSKAKGREFLLLYPAQFQRHKNHVELLRSISRLKAQNVPVKLALTGSDFAGFGNLDIESELKEFEWLVTDGCVTFHGRTTEDELETLYNECDGVVIPSAAEGGAYVALEAVERGKIVAVNRIRSAELHILQFGCEIEWFDVNDDDSIDNTICRMARGEFNLQLDQNRAAVRRIRSTDWQLVAGMWAEVIYFVLGRRERPIMKTTEFFREIQF